MRLFIFICCILIAQTFGYVGIFKKRFEECMPLSVFGSIIPLYICGLFSRLKVGVVMVIGISILIFLAGLTKSIISKQFKKYLSNIITFGFVVMLLSFVFIYYMTAGRLLSYFDEFTHWGLTVKNYIIFDGFANVAGSTTHGAGYQPGISLLCYLFTALRGYINEGDVLQAMNVYVIAMMLPVFRKITWKRFVYGIFIIPLIYVLPWLFSSSIIPFNTLYVDCAMAVSFAYMLFTYFSNEQNVFTYFSMMLSSITLILVKPASEFFALMILGIILLDVIFFKRREFGKMCKTKGSWIFPALYVFTSVAAYLSWKIFTAKNNMLQVLDYMEVDEAHAASSSKIFENFKEAFFSIPQKSQIKISYLAWVIVFVVLGIFVVILAKGRIEKKRSILFSILIIIGYIAYSGALFFMYVYTFTSYEGENLASMDRYLSIYLLGAVVFFLFMIIHNIISRFGGFGNILILIPIALVCLFVPWKKFAADTINCKAVIEETKAKRMEYESVEKIPKNLDYKTDRVYFICQDSNGYEYQVSYYLATPVALSYDYSMGWSLGQPYSSKDVWTLDMSKEEWEEALMDGEYTYVFAYNVDKQFRSLYGSLFENPLDITDNTCYKVNIKDGHVTLSRAF